MHQLQITFNYLRKCN